MTGSELTGMKQGNVSKHLGVLLNARFVARRREGNFARYALADKRLYQLCELMCMRSRTTPASGPRSWPDSLANKNMDSPEAQPYSG